MEYSVKELENYTVIIKLEGDIDIYSSSDVQDIVNEQIDLGNKRIIIDMEDVHYIDSSGIGVFISVLSSFKKIDGKMAMIKITDTVKKVFELTKLINFFPMYSTETEALEKL